MITWQTILLILATCYNFCILPASKFLKDESFFRVDPLFDRNGCILVLVWGFCYLSTAWSYAQTPYTILVFAVEKLFYTYHFIKFHNPPLSESREVIQGRSKFFDAYGVGDGVFMIVFLVIFGLEVFQTSVSQL
jgi:hypothetical protein